MRAVALLQVNPGVIYCRFNALDPRQEVEQKQQTANTRDATLLKIKPNDTSTDQYAVMNDVLLLFSTIMMMCFSVGCLLSLAICSFLLATPARSLESEQQS